MENTGSKGGVIKPIFLMAGIPLAFSVAGFLLSRIADRKISSGRAQTQETSPEKESPERNSVDEVCGDDEDNSDHIKNTHESKPSEEHIFGLGSKIEELQEKEWEIERRFFHNHDPGEEEYVLMEFQNRKVVENERSEFLDRESSSIEVENKRFDELVIDYLEALEKLESFRSENVWLRRRVKNLSKKVKKRSGIVRKQNLKIVAREAVISRRGEELDKKDNIIKAMESEVEKMQALISRLQEEKNELSSILEIAENSASLKADEQAKLVEDYYQLANQLENIQKDRAAEVKELICLRWCNACLRHKLMRTQQELEEKTDGTKNHDESDLESGGSGENEANASTNIVPHDEPFFGYAAGDRQGHSKRLWLVRKFKKWVDGNEKAKHKKLADDLIEKHHEFNCFGSHSEFDEAEKRDFAGSQSYTSA